MVANVILLVNTRTMVRKHFTLAVLGSRTGGRTRKAWVLCLGSDSLVEVIAFSPPNTNSRTSSYLSSSSLREAIYVR
jgi:hypothetical protein